MDPPTGMKVRHQEDGSIEVTDTLPKRDYYKSLRAGGQFGPGEQGTLQSQTSQHSSANNKTTTPIADFKPSGKMETATVIMLDGTEQAFEIDRASFGQHLFDAVCDHLDLGEREFFGLTFKQAPTWYWLRHDKKISKEIGKGKWQFEFQVKFYPPRMDYIKEDLTRYYLCLQVRQDIVSGQLPCSFTTYVLLGAYVVQSEAGDFDPGQHFGTDYIKHQPFAPQQLQTDEMLERIVELHRIFRGQSPEEADKNFLENARKLAMYGVDMHKAKDSREEDVCVGVYHGGILIYRGRLRIHRYSWARILKFTYKSKNFIVVIRAKEGSKDTSELQIVFKCKDGDLSQRLWNACAEHHSFFRMREGEAPQKPHLMPGFSSRKYHYSGPTLQQVAAQGTDRPQPRFRRNPTHRKPVEESRKYWDDTLTKSGPAPFAQSEGGPGSGAGGLDINGKDQMNREIIRPSLDPEHWRMSPSDCNHGMGMDPKGLDIAATRGAGWQGCRSNKGVKSPGQFYYEASVVEDGLVRLGWSTNDASLELGTDNEGFGYGSDQVSYGPKGKGRKMTKGEATNYGEAVNKGDVIGCHVDLDSGAVVWSKNGHIFEDGFTIPEQLRLEPFFPSATLKDARVEFNFGDQPFKHYPKGPWIPVSQSADDLQVSNKNAGWRMNPYDSTTNIDVAPNGLALQSQTGRGWQGCRSNKGVCGAGKYYYEATPQEANGLARLGWSTEDGKLDLGTDKFGFGYGADRQGFGLNGAQGKKLNSDDIDNYGEAFTKDDVIGCFIDLDKGTVQWSKNGKNFGEAYNIPGDMLNTSAFFPTASLNDSTVNFNFGDSPFKYFPGEDWQPLAYAPNGNTKQSKRKGPELSLHHTNAKTVDRQEDVLGKNANTVVVKPKPRTVRADSYLQGQNDGMEHVDFPDTLTANANLNLNSSAISSRLTNITNGEYTTVEHGDPEFTTETYIDEFGNKVTRTVRRTKVVTKMTSSHLITERSENEVAHQQSKHNIVRAKSKKIVTSFRDEDDDALTLAILKVTGFDPNTSVLNDSVGDVEIRGNNSQAKA